MWECLETHSPFFVPLFKKKLQPHRNAPNDFLFTPRVIFIPNIEELICT